MTMPDFGDDDLVNLIRQQTEILVSICSNGEVCLGSVSHHAEMIQQLAVGGMEVRQVHHTCSLKGTSACAGHPHCLQFMRVHAKRAS